MALSALGAFVDLLTTLRHVYSSSDAIRAINIFAIGGILCFLLVMAYMAYMLLSGGEYSRPVFLMFFTATAWMLSIYLMDLYPWNIVIAIMIFLPGPFLIRKSKWQALQRKHIENVGRRVE